jgi:cob(I)alamin adenosyltransferase
MGVTGMKIYTKNGDGGTTELIHTKHVSKADDRIELLGTIDELTSHLGLVRSMTEDPVAARMLETIQNTLITVMAGVADPYSHDYKISENLTVELEQEIDRLEALFERPKHFILPGSSQLSAQIDVARTVARRAERALAAVSVKFGSDNGTKKYMNRLADYLYVLARYTDAQDSASRQNQMQGYSEAAGRTNQNSEQQNQNAEQITEAVIQEVTRRMGYPTRITLDLAKQLIERIEQEAKRRGKQAVIAVCGPDGNPIAVHVMDGAFLVSFDVAVKKAYTSVAVKMSTMELNALAQPGGTFYGLDKMEGGNIIIFGGGIPLKVGDTIIGGLGVSGGTGEEDHSLAEYGVSVLHEILRNCKGR